MDPWMWLVVYLLAFVLLQLVLIRYVLGESSAPDSSHEYPSPGRARSRASAQEPQPEPEAESEGTVHCQHCGTANESDPAYSFCRFCASPLR